MVINMELTESKEKAIRERLKLDDTHDLKSFWDTSLLDAENIENIKEQFGMVVSKKIDYDEYKVKLNEYRKQFNTNLWGWVDKASAVGIIGGQQTGKTAIAFTIMEQSKKPVYVLRHPKPYLIQALGYKMIYNLSDIERLQDCLIFIDDIQLVLPTYDKRANDGLLRLLSKSAQRGVGIVFTTNDTRFVTRGLENYFYFCIFHNI